MSRKVAIVVDFRTRLAELSEWQTATRDDVLVVGEVELRATLRRCVAVGRVPCIRIAGIGRPV